MRIPFPALALAAALFQLAAGPEALAQRKPHDIGNCFQWAGCKGDSIGRMWVHAPEFCGSIGGRSWLDESLLCHDLTDSRSYATEPFPPQKPAGRRSPGRPAR